MRIDFSTVFLLLVLVIPGLFSQKSRNRLAPRSFAPQGATAELAELVTLGIVVHLLIAFAAFSIAGFVGLLRQDHFSFYLSTVDRWDWRYFLLTHKAESMLLASTYILFTFGFGYLLGFVYGLAEINSPISSRLFRESNLLQRWGIQKLLERWGIQGLLNEKPIIYEVLNPRIDEHGSSNLIFVEVEMKDGAGIYAGQVRKYAIVKDEEPHKLIYLDEIWFKQQRKDEYVQIQADGVMIDLADVSTLKVRQESRFEVTQGTSSS